MKLNKLLDYKLIGVFGSILLIISEFLPWFTSTPLFNVYFITINTAIEEAFLYLFPLVSGLIALFGNSLSLIKYDFENKSILLNILSIGFMIIFFFDFIPSQIFYTFTNVGIYFCISGFLLTIIDLILILISNNDR